MEREGVDAGTDAEGDGAGGAVGAGILLCIGGVRDEEAAFPTVERR